MKQGMCVLPVQCKRCDAVFDLWYDLHLSEYTGRTKSGKSGALVRALRDSLCWRCRQSFLGELQGRAIAEENIEEADELLLSFEQG